MIETMRWIRYAVGFVFIISGVLKVVDNSFIEGFRMMGMPYPEVSVYVIGMIELACGMLIVGEMYLRFSSMLLLLIMGGAIFVDKVPVLFSGGLLTFLFEVRLNVVLIILLILIYRMTNSPRSSSS